MKRVKILNQEPGIKNQRDVLQILLENRGMKSKKEISDFLDPKLEDVTFEKVKIDRDEIKKALSLIKKTIKEKKAIVIYGDYDVDGICATAILWETLYSGYKNVHPYIPHRIDEGYGISIQGIENSKKKIENIGLIITVDNGIVANEAIDYALNLGIKTIITDHHAKGSRTPNADAIIHTAELCGAGVAYFLAKEILLKCHPEQSEGSKNGGDSSATPQNDNEDMRLELVALATVADLVPLNKYNRALLKFGLLYLRKTKRMGLLELFSEAKIDKNKIGTYEIGHIIAPRLNASGRISHALDSLRLICTTNRARAKKLALELGKTNRERQQITLDSALDAVGKIKNQKSKITNLIFVESEIYEQGVIGLIASRLVEEFYRPSIAVSVGQKISKGSARSIKGVNIIDLIRRASDLLSEAGGHPMAAGFSLPTERLQEFKNKMIKIAEKNISKKLFERILTVDLELPFGLISPELYQKIQKLSPFGMGNPEPVFITRNVTVSGIRSVGGGKEHLKFILQKDGYAFPAIYFRAENNGFKIGDIIDVIYKINENDWNGERELELQIKTLGPGFKFS